MKILHVFRSPVGGLFRHVCDLVEAQHAAGYKTGILCDSLAGGDYSAKLIEKLGPFCELGIKRMPMPRMPAMSDWPNIAHTAKIASDMGVNILHGHGSKGGLFARMAGRRIGRPSVYTPHGGVLNYSWASASGPLFLGTEKLLVRVGSGLAFVCDYERQTFDQKIGIRGKPYIVAHNGLWPREFQRVVPDKDASDLIFAGEMRYNKGVDLLLEALVSLNKERRTTLTLAGDGVQFEEYKALAITLGLTDVVRFVGRVPIQQAFRQGRIFVMPSRFESFPYVLMEAIAAELPVISTRIGGVAEVVPASMLTASVSVEAIARKIRDVLAHESEASAQAKVLAASLAATTTVMEMTKKISGLYVSLLATSQSRQPGGA